MEYHEENLGNISAKRNKITPKEDGDIGHYKEELGLNEVGNDHFVPDTFKKPGGPNNPTNVTALNREKGAPHKHHTKDENPNDSTSKERKKDKPSTESNIQESRKEVHTNKHTNITSKSIENNTKWKISFGVSLIVIAGLASGLLYVVIDLSEKISSLQMTDYSTSMQLRQVISNMAGKESQNREFGEEIVLLTNKSLKQEQNMNELESKNQELTNQSMAQEQEMQELKRDLTKKRMAQEQEMQELKSKNQELTNKSMAQEHVMLELKLQLQEIKEENTLLANKSLEQDMKIKDMITNAVAITSCAAPHSVDVVSGGIIRFANLITSTGVTSNTLESYKTTGVFRCTIPGLYMVTVGIMSGSSDAIFKIHKNTGTTHLRYVQISPESSGSNKFHTGTGSVVVMLDVNDTVYIKSATTIKVFGRGYSCMTIFKIN